MLYFGPSQISDSNNDPVNGGKLFVYESGTSTLTTIYADDQLTTPLPNPLIADAGGYLVHHYTAVENVKHVVTDDQGVLIASIDPLAGIRLAQVSPGIEDTATGTRAQVQDTLMRFDDPVLIGRLTDTPQAYMHIVRGLGDPPGTTAPPTNANALMIEGDQATGMYFFTPNGDAARVAFGAPAEAVYAEMVGQRGAATDPTFDMMVGGKIAQRYTKTGPLNAYVNKTNVFINAATATWEDVTDLSITIASPSADALFRLSCSGALTNTGGASTAFGRFTHDIGGGDVEIGIGDAAGSRQRATVQYDTAIQAQMFRAVWIDQPGITGNVTYKFQIRGETTTAALGRGSGDGDNATNGRYPTVFSVEYFGSA